MANSISIDGTDLSAFGLYVVRSGLPGTPEGMESIRTLAQQDGGISSARTFGPREITTEVAITAATHSALLSNLDSIKAVLAAREDVEVKWDRWTDRYWLGRTTLADVRLDGPTLASASLVTTCADPIGWAVSESTKTESGLDIGVGGQSITVTAAGTSLAYPEIVLTASGASTPFTIEHDAQDTRLVYTGAFAAGDKLRIDCDPANWTVERMPSGDDTYVSVMQYVDGQWPYLSVGDNVFTLYTFTGAVTWTWRNRYL